VLSLGAESWRAVAAWVGDLDVDFEVVQPPQLHDDLHALARRFTDAAAV
jgi:hypothetical protein